MKSNGQMEEQLHSFFTFGSEWSWVVSFRPCLFNS